ncbi:yrdC domain-containing protein, mitochondrial [Papilio machaon]|uniref:yrdC domain-containing protein, mitochondrial n=1 Tax=Papilio machaon TaxID=76193 RepID=UPI001E6657ED|nr:yrdC domain-containing protein, mitochondrial [Papilio machaon]
MICSKRLKFISLFLFRHKSVSAKMKIDKMAEVVKCSQEKAYARAAQFLEDGHVIAVPTDTIYGLACSANCPQAIKKLYAIKGRDSAKPVAICVTYIDDVRKWGNAEHLSDDLLHTLLPGPVTVVLEKTRHLNNPFLNPKTSKIGIRIPQYLFINKVTKIFDKPIALTSANFSNEPSTLSVKEFEHLYGHLGAVFDGGVLSEGLEKNRTGSTVVDLSNIGSYTIIRKGISYEKIVTILEDNGLRSIE